MAGKLGKLASDAALYGVSSILGRMLNYLLVPFYTGIFTAAAYGVITEIYAYAAFFNVVFTFGMETAFFRFATKEKDNRTGFYSTAFSGVLLVSTVLSLIMLFGATSISNWLQYPGKESYIHWMALTMWVDAIMAIPFALLRLQGKAKRFVFIRLLSVALNIFFNIFFYWICRDVSEGRYWIGLQPFVNSFYNASYGVGYVFVANLLANFIAMLFLLPEISQARLKLKWLSFQPMLVYAYPILLMGLSGMVNEMLGRAMLKSYLPKGFYEGLSNEAALGIFGAVYKLSVFMQLTIQAFKYAAEPYFFNQSSDKNAPSTFAVVMKWFVLFCLLIFVGVSTQLNFIAPIFLKRPEYLSGLVVVPILLLANLFLGVYYNLSIWFKLVDKTWYGSLISIAGALLTIVLNILLIPILGYVGSALGTLVCYFMMALWCYLAGQKYYPIPYQIYKISSAIIVACFAVALLTLDKTMLSIGGRVLVELWHISLFVSFLLYIYLTEKKYLQPLLSRFIKK